VRSSAEGEFVVLYLDPGTYEVSIRKNGFGKLVLKDITVSVGTRAILHPQLSWQSGEHCDGQCRHSYGGPKEFRLKGRFLCSWTYA
jgi:hypothetical protein